MKQSFDLRDVWDDCYSGYEDFSTSVELCWNGVERRWENEAVCFEKDETLGWLYRTVSGQYNYGYDTLREAVIKYAGGLTGKCAGHRNFCASRFQNTDYHHDLRTGTISCSVTIRYFLPECDQERFNQTCDDLTETFDLMLQ